MSNPEKDPVFWYYNDEWPILAEGEGDGEAEAEQDRPLQVPTVDVFEDGDALVLKAELPGVKKEEIDIEVAGDVITISGKHAQEQDIGSRGYYRHERIVAEFRRSVALPMEVDAAAVTAHLEEGVLEVRAHRKARAEKIHVS
jgi:HSP20 family protein